jgi:hypothetical protein
MKRERLKIVLLATVAILAMAFLFVRSLDTTSNTYADKLVVQMPAPNAIITSPLIVSGSARGPWYFEASFPVKLLDGAGNELAVTPATAQGEWMTEEFVPFTARLEFAAPATDTGTLVLQKDNPSGLPEYDDSFSIPVRFR